MSRNKLGVVLIALQIAFTMTVMVNAIYIIQERSKLMGRPSGLDEENVFYVSSVGFGDNFNEEITAADDLRLLRNTPGIVNASVINSMPVSGGGSSTGVRLIPGDTQPSVGVAIYYTDTQIVDSMGLNLVAGGTFVETDQRYRSQSGETLATTTVISRAVAERMFPELSLNEVVGQTLYMPSGSPLQIKGVVDVLQAPWPTSDLIERSIMVPEQYLDNFSTYLIRAEPGQRDRLMVEVEELLVNANNSRVVRGMESLENRKAETYRVDSAMSTVLWVLIYMLVFITGLGIVGLAVFGINRRRKQIGTRRALGATRLAILRYFLLENIFITAVGVFVGAILTIALSIGVSSLFNMPAMPWYYTPLGMLTLILLGQLAVLGPSRGAARIEPAIATRSV